MSHLFDEELWRAVPPHAHAPLQDNHGTSAASPASRALPKNGDPKRALGAFAIRPDGFAREHMIFPFDVGAAHGASLSTVEPARESGT